jgi:hypothetical protein
MVAAIIARSPSKSTRIRFLLIGVHEMFHATFHDRARDSSVPQVADQAGVAGGQPAEFGARHPGATQKDFDPAN